MVGSMAARNALQGTHYRVVASPLASPSRRLPGLSPGGNRTFEDHREDHVMMIDPLVEQLLLPREAAKFFPPGPAGKTLHVAAIYRYMSAGVRGVVLESLNSPRKCTSKQAIARFLNRLSSPAHVLPKVATAAAPARGDRTIELELDRLGF